MRKLMIDNLSYSIDRVDILQDISLTIQPGEFVGLIGPNGSGKSTLLKHVYRVLKPKAGTIAIDNVPLEHLSAQDLARKIAVVAQEVPVEFDFSVNDIVMMGRYPYKSLLEQDTSDDAAIVAEALEEVEMLAYRDRSFQTLSGGEKQRVLIARALAQTTDFLILDEPTNHLDPGSMLHIMNIIKNLNLTTFAAVHDLNIAALYCDRIIVMQAGRIVRTGTPEEIFEPNFILKVYGVKVAIDRNPLTQKPQITYIPDRIDVFEHTTPQYLPSPQPYRMLKN